MIEAVNYGWIRRDEKNKGDALRRTFGKKKKKKRMHATNSLCCTI